VITLGWGTKHWCNIHFQTFYMKAHKANRNIKFNIIFLAAAEPTKTSAPFVQAHKQSITNLRSFAMKTTGEKATLSVPVL